MAPTGTGDSKTCSPTLDHLPIGSRLTPRLIRFCARSRRRVRRVFARIVTGLGDSLASKKAIACLVSLVHISRQVGRAHLVHREQLHELLHQEQVVTEVRGNVVLQLEQVIAA